MNTKNTFSLIALGCRTNQYEVEAIKNQLRVLGLKEAVAGEEADICIINTCTVTESADASSRHSIREMKRMNPHAKIIVTGCMADRDRDMILSIDPNSVIVSNIEKEQLVSVLFPEIQPPEFMIRQFDGHTRAFIKVQDGCDSFCSYCMIPYVRGRSRSRPPESIIREVQGLIEEGFKEIVLTGINVGDFTLPDGKKGLGSLVRSLDELPGLHRLRISSIDPNDVDDDLFSAYLSGKHTCPSMHIVLQSGSNVTLKRMNRRYTRQEFLHTVKRIQEKRSDFTFTTDIIVGFPQETEDDFQETLQMVRAVPFAKVHIFPYSDRPKTRASFMTNKISSDEIKRRKLLLHEEASKAAFSLRERFIGETVTLLTEHSREGEGTVGHTEHFIQVYVPEIDSPPNTLLSVRIIGNSKEGLIGQCLSS